MEQKAASLSESDTEREEERVIELGEVSQETQGGLGGFQIEYPGRYW